MARVAFLGNSPWSVPTLEALVDSPHDVVLAVTRTPRPARRTGETLPTPVASAARKLGVTCIETGTVRSGEGFGALAAAAPDVLVVVAYGEILSAAVLATPRLAAVNLHFSLLPRWRGAAPVQHALLAGDAVTGVTTMRMDEGLDTGDVLLQQEEAVDPMDDTGSLGDRLARTGAALVVRTVDGLADGTLTGEAQDDRAATYAPKLASRTLDWTGAAGRVAGFVRAMSPAPGAATTWKGAPLKVLRVAVEARSGPAGTVLDAAGEGPLVACGEGSVRLLRVAPSGRKQMSGADFVRGYHPGPGERFA